MEHALFRPVGDVGSLKTTSWNFATIFKRAEYPERCTSYWRENISIHLSQYIYRSISPECCIATFCTKYQHPGEYFWEQVSAKVLSGWERTAHKSSLIVDGLPNWVAVERSRLKHIIHTRALFRISRSWVSDVGLIVDTWWRLRSVAILGRTISSRSR